MPDATISFGINFEFGTVLPQLPASRQVDGITHLPDVTRHRFHLAGSTWDLPTYDDAEAFVAALVREGLLVQDRPVAQALHRPDPYPAATRHAGAAAVASVQDVAGLGS